MKKKNYTLASATIVGLAIATSGGAAFADESTPAPATSPVAAPSSEPSEVSVAPKTGDVKPSSLPTDTTEPSTASVPKTTEKDLVLVHTNDVHGRIVEEKGRDKNTSVVGDAKLATVIENERAEILNKMNYDAMAVGNHEFDFGLDEAKKYKQILKFPLLSSNTYVNGARLFEASTIIDKDKSVKGDEVVVIGVTTPETATKTHPKNVQGVTFKDPIPEVLNVVKEIQAKAKATGDDYKTYVVLAHLGVDTTTPNEWRGSTLADELSKSPLLKGKRVVVIDGHSHTVESKTYGDNVTYNQTGSYLNNIGKVTLKPNSLLGTPSLIKASETTNVTPNAEVKKLVDQIKEKYDAENAVVVVKNSPVELSGTRENVRVRETNLGNVVADSLYEYGQTGFKNKADIAVTNGGGLRETIAKDKPITKGSVIAVLPFGNTISQISVTGKDVLAMFEKSLGSILQVDKDGKTVLDENGQPLLEPSGGFLHVSGAKVYYDTNLPSGKRVLRVEVKNHDTGAYDKLDLAKTYYLTTNDFLAAGGDGYTMLGGAREEGPSMDEAFKNYLEKADLTKYAVVNPNSRTISVDSKTYKFEEKKAEQPKEDNSYTGNVGSGADQGEQATKEEGVTSGKVEQNGNNEQGKVENVENKGEEAKSEFKETDVKLPANATSKQVVENSKENKLSNTGMNSSSTTALGLSLIALVGAAVRRKLSE